MRRFHAAISQSASEPQSRCHHFGDGWLHRRLNFTTDEETNYLYRRCYKDDVVCRIDGYMYGVRHSAIGERFIDSLDAALDYIDQGFFLAICGKRLLDGFTIDGYVA